MVVDVKRAVVRLPSEIVERLDMIAQKLCTASPDRAVSRAAVVRALIAAGLEVAEADPARLAPGAGSREGAADRIAEAGAAGRSHRKRGRG